MFLVPHLVLDVVTPTSYYIQQYPSAGDHVGVIMLKVEGKPLQH